ncbi:MAG: T9SS type A sorting domain-containing protein, partial [Bacteroidota bacterium]|nr:T9SS type A sorting domain-containing protein [Bacteroidota bacterium]
VVGSASFDAVIDVLSGACTGTNISCGDTSLTGGTEVLNATGLTIGDTYLVRVYHYSSSIPATTTFSICITTPCAAPNTTVTPASATICNGNSTTLTANGANSYSWLPTTGLSSSTSAIVTANPTTTTTYTVTGTFNGCSGTQVVTVTVDPAATANITQIENLLTSTPGTAYQWYLNGIIIPGATSQSHLASQNGNYTVTTTNATGCEATSNPFPIISFLGISKNDGTNVITIYPNPFSTSATLEIKGAVGNGNVALVVYDMVGREVKNIPLSNSQSNSTQSGVSFTIDRNELSNGMYFYKVSNENGVIGSGKFSIQ